MRQLTKEAVMAIADQEPFFVHKYKWKDGGLRKLLRRLAKAGVLEFTGQHGHYLIYKAPSAPAPQQARK